MAEPVQTPEEIRGEIVARIAKIDRHLATGLTESREEDEQAKWDLGQMRRERAELQAKVDVMDGAVPRANRVRSIRVVASKGY
ncbi:hypothetical protein BHAOGJBA_1706 [Methylobacterium hispanicum]|uniref:Uncharacterized protein n=2 Tax=Methylobacterium TaxID=407 RepID=A0AAV4ZIN7_9HYPH|nr:hypothetical protein [Methylobacterium hispanicum]GJD88193.1 hypothetical protein BHAOGJBA_1706 [Methylobacterium hispanicum]